MGFQALEMTKTKGIGRSKEVRPTVLLVLLVVLLQACANGNSVTEEGYTFDPSQPEQVLKVVFDVASGKAAPQLLAQICREDVPLGPETRRICEYAQGFDPQGEFPMFFGQGAIRPGSEIVGKEARVPFSYGPNGLQQDTMTLAKVDGKWYLSHF